MNDNGRKGIRRVLKSFGIQADEALTAYLARHPDVKSLQVRITLESVSNYENGKKAESLHLVVEDTIEIA